MKKKLLIALISVVILCSGLFFWRGTLLFEVIDMYIDLNYAGRDVLSTIYLTKNLPVDVNTIPDDYLIIENTLVFKHDFEEYTMETTGTYADYIQLRDKRIIYQRKKQGELGLIFYEADLDKRQMVTDMYGGEFFEDDYSTLKAILKMTHWDMLPISFLSNKKLKANLILLKLKARTPIESSVFEFETEQIKGFQFNSTSAIGVNTIFVFNSKHKNSDYFDITFYGDFSSEEIDLILSTMKFVE